MAWGSLLTVWVVSPVVCHVSAVRGDEGAVVSLYIDTLTAVALQSLLYFGVSLWPRSAKQQQVLHRMVGDVGAVHLILRVLQALQSH